MQNVIINEEDRLKRKKQYTEKEKDIAILCGGSECNGICWGGCGCGSKGGTVWTMLRDANGS